MAKENVRLNHFLTYENWDEDEATAIMDEERDYFGILKWAYSQYNDKIIYACSFGAEGIVLIDLISKIKKDAKIIFLDTDLHFQETYDLIEEVKNRYPSLQVKMVRPKLTLLEQKDRYGDELWTREPNLCCYLRKIAPLEEALKDSVAWISGLRREQSPIRKNTQYINLDHKFKKIKICPLIHWTWDEIMTYIELNNLPYNPLHDQGYPSIGCAPCTRPIKENEDFRAGRWSGMAKTECGLHVN